MDPDGSMDFACRPPQGTVRMTQSPHRHLDAATAATVATLTTVTIDDIDISRLTSCGVGV